MSRVDARSDDQRKQIALAERAKYYREWRKKNPGKQAEYNLRYWARKAEERQKQEEALKKAGKQPPHGTP